MKRELVNAPLAPKAIGPYSHAVKHGGTVFTSGQIPLDPATGKLVDGDVRAQTRQVFANLKTVLDAAGSSFDRVVKATVFLKDLGDFKALNEVYQEFLGEVKPARSTVQVARLPMDAAVEIELVAACGD